MLRGRGEILSDIRLTREGHIYARAESADSIGESIDEVVVMPILAGAVGDRVADGFLSECELTPESGL
jgi:hypothetical protein